MSSNLFLFTLPAVSIFVYFYSPQPFHHIFFLFSVFNPSLWSSEIIEIAIAFFTCFCVIKKRLRLCAENCLRFMLNVINLDSRNELLTYHGIEIYFIRIFASREFSVSSTLSKSFRLFCFAISFKQNVLCFSTASRTLKDLKLKSN